MKLSDISVTDGKSCAFLVEALTKAFWKETSMDDLQKIQIAKQWLSGLAAEMGKQLRTPVVPNSISVPLVPNKLKKLSKKK